MQGWTGLTICKLLLLEHGALGGRIQVLQCCMLVRTTLRHSHHGGRHWISRCAGNSHVHLRLHPAGHALLTRVMRHAWRHGMAARHTRMLLHGVWMPKRPWSHCHHV